MASMNSPAAALEMSNTKLPFFSFGGHEHTFEQIGFEHGTYARKYIQGFLDTEFCQEMRAVRDGAGREFFKEMKFQNRKEFPSYASEIEGIAEGAQVPADDIWMLNLMDGILGSIDAEEWHPDPSDSQKNLEHCSTFAGIYAGEIMLGHTEDWSESFLEYLYLQDVTYPGGTRLGGFGYPGHILGGAIVGNSHGLFFSQNSVFPKLAEPGLGLIFVSRRAMDESNLETAIERLLDGNLASGMSCNIMSFSKREGASVERGGRRSDVQRLSGPSGFFNHFNHFSHLPEVNQTVFPASRDRNATQLAMGPPQTPEELLQRLCYRGDGQLKDAIYRDITMMTWTVRSRNDNGVEALIWCGACADQAPPVLVWSPTEGFRCWT